LSRSARADVLQGIAGSPGEELAMAKGQMRSNREMKKPKKTEAEKAKAKDKGAGASPFAQPQGKGPGAPKR
jgi:hypothetical protein